MQKEFKRAERVAELFQIELAGLLKRAVADPRLKNITITLVRVTDDLGLAKVYFTFFASTPEKIREVLQGLKSASGFFRSHLARVSQLRKVPALVFYYDNQLDRAEKITYLIETTRRHDQEYLDVAATTE